MPVRVRLRAAAPAQAPRECAGLFGGYIDAHMRELLAGSSDRAYAALGVSPQSPASILHKSLRPTLPKGSLRMGILPLNIRERWGVYTVARM